MKLFVTTGSAIETIRRRDPSPKLIHYFKGFRPALVAIASDHIRNNKAAVVCQGSLHLLEQSFEIQDVVQGLVGNCGVAGVRRSPAVKVGLNKFKIILNACLLRSHACPIKHGGVQVDAIDYEGFMPAGAKLQCEFNLQIAIARAETDKTLRPASPFPAPLFKELPEHCG